MSTDALRVLPSLPLPRLPRAGGYPVVEVKLRPPASRRGRGSRDRLVREMDRGADRSLTVVTAPVGYGKSTAVGAWFARSGCEGTWLTLDTGDREPARLLAHLVAGVERVVPGTTGPAWDALTHGEDPLQVVVPLLAGALTDRDGEPFVFVLDDYDTVAGAAIDEVVAGLVDLTPPEVRVVVVGRRSPRIGLARRRLFGDLHELGPDELRLTTAELRDVADGRGRTLDDAGLAELERTTGGWPVAAELLLGADPGEALPPALVALFDEEVLAPLEPEMRRFLLRTAVLGQLSGERCAHLLRDPHAHRLLQDAHQGLALLTPCADDPRWLVHPPITRSLLLRRLEVDADGTGQLLALRQRAEAWTADGTLVVHPTAGFRGRLSVVGSAGRASTTAPTEPAGARRYDAIPGSHPTAAELRVLRAMTSDQSLGEIARALYLSRNTVKSHVRRLYVRLEVSDRPAAIAAGRRRGIL